MRIRLGDQFKDRFLWSRYRQIDRSKTVTFERAKLARAAPPIAAFGAALDPFQTLMLPQTGRSNRRKQTVARAR